MSRPYWRARHVSTRALLPAVLDRGRAYFIDDEQIIVIDHGNGPVEYGGKPGPQGQPGEPIPSLQGQIEYLAEASLRHTITIRDIFQRTKNRNEHIEELLLEHVARLDESDTNTSNAILSLLNLINRKFRDYDAELYTIVKTIANLYPESFQEHAGDGLSGVTSGTLIDDGTGTIWIVDKSYTEGNSGVVILTFYDSYNGTKLSTLKVGDNVTYDSGSFKVNAIDRENGTITLTLYES